MFFTTAVSTLLLIAAGCFAAVASATAQPDRARHLDKLCRNISIAATVALVAFIYGVVASA